MKTCLTHGKKSNLEKKYNEGLTILLKFYDNNIFFYMFPAKGLSHLSKTRYEGIKLGNLR